MMQLPLAVAQFINGCSDMLRAFTEARALALDYDDTLAEGGVVRLDVLCALRRLRTSRRLILVTGREIGDLVRIFPDVGVFDRVIGENGGVLFRPAENEQLALAGPPDRQLVCRLENAGVRPLSVGRVIIATRFPNEPVVAGEIRGMRLDLSVIRNKGAVMVLPRGINKGSGVLAALSELEIPAATTIAIGDAENDVDLFDMCGYGIAVANAVPLLKQRAHYITGAAAGRGVLEIADLVTGDTRGRSPSAAISPSRHRT